MEIAILIILSSLFITFYYSIKHIKKTIDSQFQYHIEILNKLKCDTKKESICFKEIYFKNDLSLPIIKIKIQKQEVNMILDSGANINYLNTSVLKTLKGEFNIRESNAIQGVSEEQVQSGGTITTSFKIGNKSFADDFDILDLDKTFQTFEKRANIKIDGILGNKFFTEYQWVLDFENMVVWVKQ